MIQINDFPKTKLLVEEIYILGLMVTEKIEEAGAEKLGVFPQFVNLQRSVFSMENCLYKLPKGVYQKRASFMKTNIIKFIQRLFEYIESFPTKGNPEIIYAKDEIMDIVDQYRASDTRSFDNLVKANLILADILNSDKYKTSVSLLDLALQLESLDTINKSAKDLTSKKLIYNGLNQRIRRTDIVRGELLRNYEKIVVKLNKLALAYKTDIYKTLFKWWNDYVDELMIQINIRGDVYKNISVKENIFSNDDK